MAELKEARVPDIGGHSDVPVIELLVSPGDTVAKDQGLVTLESDKATMEVPSPFAGVVKELKVKLGDNLSEGGLVALIETADAAPAAAPEVAKAPATEAPVKSEPKQDAKAEAKDEPKVETATPAPADSAAPMGAGLPPVRFEADAVLPDKVHRVIYERMVDDTEAEVRALLAHCGLDFESGCLAFHETKRAVRTASSEQVRQPIFRSGLDQWENYLPYLNPLRTVLGPELVNM